MAKSLRKKAEALIRREATLKTQTTQDAVKSDDAAAQPQARVKRKYVRKGMCQQKRNNLFIRVQQNWFGSKSFTMKLMLN